MSNFKVGKKVVAIKSHSAGFFKKGQEFILIGIKERSCCGNLVLDIGFKSDYFTGTQCNCGKINEYDSYFSASSFRPIDELSNTTYDEVMQWIESGQPIEILN